MNLKIPNLEGERQAITANLETRTEMPAGLRALIIEQIGNLPGEYNGVRVCGSIETVQNLINVHVSISGRKLTR